MHIYDALARTPVYRKGGNLSLKTLFAPSLEPLLNLRHFVLHFVF
jgi:hypothetical protein